MDLGPLPPYASQTYPTGLNGLGHVVGYAHQPGFRYIEAVLWTEHGTGGPPQNPQLRGLGNFAGHDYWHGSQAFGVNNRGQVVGWASGTGLLLDPWHAFVWEAGGMLDLGTLEPYGWGSSMARAIDDAGHVVGWAQTQPGDSYSGNPHAFLYEPATREMHDLGVDESWANDLNASLQVVGAYWSGTAYKHALYWDAEHGARDLHELVSAGGRMSEASAINDSGLVVGWTSDAQGVSRAFVADVNAGEVDYFRSVGESFAFDINNQGLAVGRFQYDRPSLYDFAMAWDTRSGRFADLEDLVEDASRWRLQVAWSINDAGQIAGFGNHQRGESWTTASYRLTPASDGRLEI